MILLIKHLNTLINRLLTSPEANAAERLGIFRILYSLFYLWYLSTNKISFLSSLPTDAFRQTVLLSYFLPKPLPAILTNGLEFLLVTSLIMLLFGTYTQLCTLVVLISGCLLEACYSSVDHELAMVFLVFYIPLSMVVCGGWGDTYSVDKALHQRRDSVEINTVKKASKYALPINSLIVVLSILFFSSFIYKILGSWINYPELISNLVLERNIRAAIYQLPLNRLAPFISTTPFAYHSLRIITLAFEGTFIVTVFCKQLRNIYFPLALIFHAFNAIWLNVTFTPVLILYGLFIDWSSLYKTLLASQITTPISAILSDFPAKFLMYGSIFLAILSGLLWNIQVWFPRSFFTLGGVVNWQTIWYPVLPLSVIWLLLGIIQLSSTQTIEKIQHGIRSEEA
mgnify:CR=1 FL=1